MHDDGSELLRFDEVRKYFEGRSRHLGGALVKAVDGVSFEVPPGRTLSLVGESGCGKTTVSRLALALERRTSGTIAFEGNDIDTLDGRQRRAYRTSVQAVFQDPWSSLSPRMRIGDIVSEPLRIQGTKRGPDLDQRVIEALDEVGLHPRTRGQFPHELSGGMRQRVAIARALSLRPALIVLDEPVSALDVSIRAQVMNLLRDLQSTSQVAYLLIAHDLATVRYLSHEVLVMYLGRIVERGPSEAVFSRPAHPYTVSLISAATPGVPDGGPNPFPLGGDVPSATDPPTGCRLHTRCWLRARLGDPARCASEAPEMRPLGGGHASACHYVDMMDPTTPEVAAMASA